MNRLPVKYRPDNVRYEKISGDGGRLYLVLFVAVTAIVVKYLVNRKN
jgi:hypothetical protein